MYHSSPCGKSVLMHSHTCVPVLTHIHTQSTLLNALIGERNALPTNGMRACTAVLAELSYDEDQEGYYGEVEFLTPEVGFAWRGCGLR